MNIAIVGWGMAFDERGPEKAGGLGGSETAQWAVAHALADMGHRVTNFRKPMHGEQHRRYTVRGVTYADLLDVSQCPPHDVVIVCRNPTLGAGSDLLVSAKHRVLWCQDFCDAFTPNLDALKNAQFDELWMVSEWHKKQYGAALLNRPKETWPGGDLSWIPRMWATRNGIVYQAGLPMPVRDPKQLCFVSRPERGLWALIRPGGIMERLPEYTLAVCGYDDKPHSPEWYAALTARMERMENVLDCGTMSNREVRVLLRQSSAMLLPTNYAETSCMAAREAIEQLCPVFHTPANPYAHMTNGSGAVSETVRSRFSCVPSPLGVGAVMDYDANIFETDAYAQRFAETVQYNLESEIIHRSSRIEMLARTDLYWPEVARTWTSRLLGLMNGELL